MFHSNLGWFTYLAGCQLYEPFPLIRTPAGRSGGGILLSSDTSGNLLLFAIVEGPKTGLLAVTAFPKACDFSDPCPLRNGHRLNADVWDISVHVFREDPLKDQAVHWDHLLVLPGALQIPPTCHITAKVNPMPYTDAQLANEKSSHHYSCHCLYYLQRILAQCSQLSAQCATTGLVIWGFLCRKRSCHVQARQPAMSCNTIWM